MSNCLYTQDELIAKLKEIDESLDDATTKSEIDTGQSKHNYSTSIRTLREQYEKYLSMFQTCYPAEYRSYFGPSVIKFGRSTCQ